MPIDIEALNTRVNELSAKVDSILAIPNDELPKVGREYQTWYSQVYLIVKAHVPERLAELSDLYLSTKSLYAGYYGTNSYLLGGAHRDLFEAGLEQQRGILLAVLNVIELRSLEIAECVNRYETTFFGI